MVVVCNLMYYTLAIQYFDLRNYNFFAQRLFYQVLLFQFINLSFDGIKFIYSRANVYDI